MSGSSGWPRSAVSAYGIAPCSRIHAIATVVSSPPENAIPTRSPTGTDVSTRDMRWSLALDVLWMNRHRTDTGPP